MRCLRCTDTAMPDKALCRNCYPQWLAECQARTRTYEMIGTEKAAEIAARPEELPAPIPERVLATLFDVVLLMTLSWALIWPVILMSGFSPQEINFVKGYTGDLYVLKYVDRSVYLMLKITICTYVIPAWIYFAAFELSPLKATPGKLLTGLRIRTSGQELTFGKSSQRLFFKLVPFLAPSAFIPAIKPVLLAALPLPARYLLIIALVMLFVLTVLDCLVMLFTSSHSALHDYFTRTEVVSIKDVSYVRLMLVFILAMGVVAVHAVLWGNPLVKI